MKIKQKIKNLMLRFLLSDRKIVKINIVKASYHGAFEGKKVLVTGGSKGIGFAIARKIVDEGGLVVITGRSEEFLIQTQQKLGGRSSYIIFDAEKDDITKMLYNCEQKVGGLPDAIVLNAGVSLHEGNFLNVTPEGFVQQMNINFKANYFIAQQYIKRVLSVNLGGSILFVSSETGGKYNDLPYGLSKVAINSLVGGLARRVYKKGIRINAIAPGVTFTNMKNKENNNTDNFANNSVAGRFFMPEEIAEVAYFLLSDVSNCISGEVIYCDAGSHLKINGTEYKYSL